MTDAILSPDSKWEVAERSDGSVLFVAHPDAPPVRLVVRGGRIELDRLTPLFEDRR